MAEVISVPYLTQIKLPIPFGLLTLCLTQINVPISFRWWPHASLKLMPYLIWMINPIPHSNQCPYLIRFIDPMPYSIQINLLISLGHWPRASFTLVSLNHYLTQNTLQWRHNEPDGVSNHQPRDCLLNCLFSHRSKETSKLCVTSLCEGNSVVTSEFPAQRAGNVENVSIWWLHYEWPYLNWIIDLIPRSNYCQAYTCGQEFDHHLCGLQGPLLLTWIDFNLTIDK